MNKILELFPCIYLKDGKAGCFEKKEDSFSGNPVALVQNYAIQGINGLCLIDLSVNDREHERNLDIIKEICSNFAFPTIGMGHIERFEDIKKMLYAGVSFCGVDIEKKDLLTEGYKRFGKSRIFSIINSDISNEYSGEKEIPYFTEYSCGCILRNNAIGITEEKRKSLFNNNMVFSFGMDFGADGIITDILPGKIQDFHLSNNINTRQEPEIQWESLKKNSDGLIPVIVQEQESKEVLMLAYMNRDAYDKTVSTGIMTYYSRSRQELWIKGLTSGHYQFCVDLTADCDLDTLKATVIQIGAACHTGSKTCFFNKVAEERLQIPSKENPLTVFQKVYDIIQDRKINPKEGSYTNYLFDKGIDKILKKLGEEATEIVIAAKNPNTNETKYEISDFLYHCMVLMVLLGISWEEITEDLAKR